ncbi:hypothetical protein BC938DRAFT_471301 [Jimgerdemannia flammicorona]|uniref:Beta-lactamase-like protein n=1 Tax=Jimgerdemannia flammicorona TaxID=994334 RepID=A0A433Q895_9FUNG|nr:hypothetical protein BC938DRAFT_471301 [Jimgerdemannia flammicorona]
MTSIQFDINEPDFNLVHKASEGVWTYLTQFTFMGRVPIGNRSTMFLIPHLQSLVIVNPAELSAELVDQIKAVEKETDAKVRYLLSPGDWHYLFIGAYLKHFDKAKAYVPPGRIPFKNLDFPYETYDTTLSNPLPELLPTLLIFTFRGMCAIEDPTRKTERHEYLFYHPATRALTSGDVLYYRQPLNAPTASDDALTKIGQVYGHVDFHQSRWKCIRNVAALKWSVEEALKRFTEVERFISPHGRVGNVKVGGVREDLVKITEWLEDTPEGWKDVGPQFVISTL